MYRLKIGFNSSTGNNVYVELQRVTIRETSVGADTTNTVHKITLKKF
jgi:hypothetical protein